MTCSPAHRPCSRGKYSRAPRAGHPSRPRRWLFSCPRPTTACDWSFAPELPAYANRVDNPPAAGRGVGGRVESLRRSGRDARHARRPDLPPRPYQDRKSVV